MQEAEGYRTRIVQTAEGDASRFRQVLAEYQKAPGVTRDRMYLETMQQVFSNATKVMVDSRGSNQLLYLPFDKLMQQVTQDAMAPRTPTTVITPSEPAPPAAEGRTRDSLRSRDREGR
jgi:membrane protease subunit HflK